MTKIERQKRHELEQAANKAAKSKILNTRVHLIAYFFEEVVQHYLQTVKSKPYHKQQQARAMLILWLYCNYYHDLPKQPIRDLVAFSALLVQEDPTILSIAPNQFVLLLIRYLYQEGKENLSHIRVIIKAGGQAKAEECLKYMVLAGSHINMNRDESLFNLYKELKDNHKAIAMPLGMILVTAEGSDYQKTKWIRSELSLMNAYDAKSYHATIRSYFAPTFHHLKLYLKTLLDSLRGHDRMDGLDPYLLYPLDEELATSFRNLMRYAPVR